MSHEKRIKEAMKFYKAKGKNFTLDKEKRDHIHGYCAEGKRMGAQKGKFPKERI